MKSETEVQGFRGDVQGLRAVAVGLVVLAHAHVPFLAGGFVGVDVFFVISGFLITGLLLKEAARSGRVSLATFYARRALRILPAATVVIVATAVAASQLLGFAQAKAALSDSIWTAFFAANIKLGRDGTDYFAFDQAVSPLQHFWSLAVEEQFYVVWPALLGFTLFGSKLLLSSAGRPKRLLTNRLVLVLVVLGGASLVQSIRVTSDQPVSAYFSTFCRAWELGVGALLATLLPALRRLPAGFAALLSWAGLVGIAIAALSYDTSTAFPGSAALLPVLAAAAVIAGGVSQPTTGAGALLSRQPFRFVGDISYSLYLWHWPLLILGAAYVGRPLGDLQTLLVVSLALVLATLSLYVVENPLRHPKWTWQRQPKRAMVLWPVALVSVVVVAVAAQPAVPGVAQAVAAESGRTRAQAVQAVKASVAAAKRSTPIPANPAPGFGNVHTDFKRIGECSGAGSKTTTNKVCDLGSPTGTHRVVVFGNSHATMWLPALEPLTKSANWHLTPMVKEACTLEDYTHDTKRHSCAAWYQFAAKTIKDLHPDLIVFPINLSSDAWEDATTSLIEDLKQWGTRVLVLSDAPAIQVVPLTCLLQHGATQRDCLWPVNQEYLAGSHTIEAITKRTHVEFLDVTPWFCAGGLCPSVIDNVVPFVDKGHVTATYSRVLAPCLAPSLKLSA